MREYLNDLQFIATITRQEIGNAVSRFLERHGKDGNPEHSRALFLAALDGMADLIQYGELGPAAIDRLHAARELCGIPIPK